MNLITLRCKKAKVLVSITVWVSVFLTVQSATAQTPGQTGDWNVNGGGNWSDSSRWTNLEELDPGPPQVLADFPSGVGATANVNFNINSTRTITLDVPVTLGTLKLGDTNNSNAFVIVGPETLTFDNGGAGALLNHDQTSSGGFSPSNGDRIDADVILNDTLTIDAGRNIEFRGAWDAQGNDVVFEDVARVRFNGANGTNQNGRISNVNTFTVNVGELRFDGQAGGVANVLDVQTFELSDGGLGDGAQEFARLYLVNTEATQNFDLNMNGGAWFTNDLGDNDQTFTGDIVLTDLARRNIIDLNDPGAAEQHVFTGVISGTGGFSKVNTGAMILENDNTFTGNLWIQRGRGVNLGSVHLQTATGALSGVESINLSRDGSLYLDNTVAVNNNRVNDTADIFVRGNNRIRVLGNAALPVSETMGDILIENGTGRFNMDTQGAIVGTNDIALTFGSLTRQNGGIAQFVVLDPTVGAFGAAGSLATVQLQDSGASTTQFGAGSTGTQRSIVQGAVGGVNDVANHFMTMDGDYIRPLDFETEYLHSYDLQDGGIRHSITNATLGTLDQNLMINYNVVRPVDPDPEIDFFANNPIRVTENVAVNSLRFGTNTPTNGLNNNELGSVLSLDAGVVMYLGDSLAANTGLSGDTEGSGMVLFGRDVDGTSPGSNQFIAGGILDFGSREAIFINESGNSAYIRSEIRGTGGFTKGGAQNLYLDNTNTYSGPTTISEGNLIVRDQGAFGSSGTVTIEGYGQLLLELGTEIVGVDLLVGSLDTSRSVLRTNDGHNRWGGDIIIDNVDNLGNTIAEARINVNNREVLSIDGDIYGGQLTGSTSTPIRTDTALNNGRIVSTDGSSAGIINLNGRFMDTATGPITDPINGTNENQVLRFEVQGNDETVVNVRQQWHSAGNIIHEQGILRWEGDGNFWSDEAAAVMSPNNSQSGYIQGTGTSGEDLALVLTKPGQVFNISRWNIDGDNAANTNKGNTMIAGTNTTGEVSFGTGEDRIFWVNDNAVRDLTVFAAEGGTVNVDARLQDGGNNVTSSITKIGRGTVNLRGGQNAAGNVEHVILTGGLLRLGDYGGTFAGSGQRRVDDGAAVTFAGGGIQLDGTGSTADVTENLTSTDTQVTTIGTQVLSGATQVIVTSDVGRTTTLNIGDATTPLTRNNGGTLHYRKVDNGGTAVVTFNSNGAVGGSDAVTFDSLIGPWATYAAVDGPAENWAGVNDAFQVGAFSDLTADAFGAGVHSDLTTSPATLAAATEAETIRINQATLVNLDLNGQVLTLNQGGVLNGAASSGLQTISDGAGGGSLTAAGTELVIHNFGSGGLEIGAVISGTLDVTFSGTGVTTLTADNTYDGRTFFNDGTVAIASNAALGAVPVASDADSLYFNGGTLRTTADMTLDSNRGITFGGNGAAFDVDTGTTLSFGGEIVSEANSLEGYNLNPAVGRFDKLGDGTLVLTQEVDNGFAGVFEIEAGVVRWEPAGGTLGNNSLLELFGTNQAFFDGTVVRSGANLVFAGPLANNRFTIFNEWFTFEDGSRLDFQNQDYDFDGVLNFESGFTTLDMAAGNIEVDFNERGGMLIGSGGIYKTGDGDLRLRENNSEWTGQLVIIDGEVDAMSAGKPLGSGTAPILLGYDTTAVGEPERQNNGGSTGLYLRSEGGYRDVMNLSQDVIVRNENIGANQEKRLGARYLDHVDEVNFNGSITLQDDLVFYYRDDVRNSTITDNAQHVRNTTRSNGAPTNMEVVFINYNGDISGDFDLTTRIEQFGNGNATNGSITGEMDDLVMHPVFSLAGENSGWTGDLIIAGVGQGAGDVDRLHVVSIANATGISEANDVITNHNSTFRTSANDVTIGNLVNNEAGAVIENALVGDGSITVTQTTDGAWSALFQDGVPFLELQQGETPGRLSVVKAGAAVATMIGLNTYTGTTEVTAGTLQVGVNGDGSFGTATTSFGGDEVGRTGTGLTTVSAGGALAGTGNVQGSLILGGGVVRPGDNGGTGSMGTLFVGDGSTGDLTVDSGTLQFEIAQAIHHQLDVQSGTVNYLQPDYETTILNDFMDSFSADLAVNPVSFGQENSELNTVIFGPEHDHLEISGNLNWGAGSTGMVEVVFDGYTPTAGDTFNLVDWFGLGANDWSGFDDGSGSASPYLTAGGNFGDFILPTLDEVLRWDTRLFQSHGVLFIVAPEPQRLVLVGVGMMALLLRRRRHC